MVTDGPLTCPNCSRELGPGEAMPLATCQACGYREAWHAEWPKREGRSRYKALKRQLSIKDDATRRQAMEALVTAGERVVEPLGFLVQDAGAPERAREGAALVLGRIGEDRAVELLLEAMAKQEASEAKRRRFAPAVVAVLVMLFTASVIVPLLMGDGAPSGAFGGMWGLVTVLAARAVLVRKGMANALASLSEPRAVGPLALAASEKQLTSSVIPLLTELLPRVEQEHVEGFDTAQRNALVSLLSRKEPELLRGLLRVVGMFGAAPTLGPIERLLREGPEEVWQEAAEAKRRVTKRIELQRDAATLLRASGAYDEDSERLLRAAHGEPDAEPTQLLRPADGLEESE
ncbi:MAG: hypothetical protein AMXMBFR61_15990 [Fimbriimonadales bacterium]